MADKISTRVARSITFTCDTLEEKAGYQAHAKDEGRTLAGLIKHLLKASKEGRITIAPAPVKK